MSRRAPTPSSSSALDSYRAKRDFTRTSEPRPELGPAAAEGFSFVIQKHAARRLHYDLRLELGGVYKSWAVTKGPSLDPAVKRLAVHVEDHPLAYGDFEGIIPRGQYGGGTVMIWDQGRWQPTAESDPLKDYAKGHLSFHLFGKRLKGGWNLVQMRDGRAGDSKNWLLIKMSDGAARPGDGDTLLGDDARSVVSKRSMKRIAAEADRVWDSRKRQGQQQALGLSPEPRRSLPSGAVRCHELPAFIEPQLAIPSAKAPAGADWLHEIKFDGYRMQCRVQGGAAALRSRTGLDWTDRFPAVATAAATLPVIDAILDGEIVAMLPSGVSSFSLLQDAVKAGQTNDVLYYVFDLLFLDGHDLRKATLEERKDLLMTLIGDAVENPLRFSEHLTACGPEFLENACRLALEGVVSKRRSATYRSGRGSDWRKSKCINREDFVIGGFTRASAQAQGIGALLVGIWESGTLTYAGRVGTGFTRQVSEDLRRRLQELAVSDPPFSAVPVEARRGATWVQPTLVCDVEFGSWTAEGRLRHASFQQLKEGAPAGAAAMRKKPRRPARTKDDTGSSGDDILERIHLTHPDRVLYAAQGITKRGLAEYYVEVAPWMLPHIVNRPISIVRCPDGAEGACFYQKHIGKGLPDRFQQLLIREKKGEVALPIVQNLEDLLTLVQLSALELHPWGARADDIERPDRLTFDLDPDTELPWQMVVDAAFDVRERLAARNLRGFVKTTGGKGLHVVVPLSVGPRWPEVRAFTSAFAEAMARAQPDRYTARLAKQARTGKIFIDYLRNSRGATAIAAYSPRARSGGPVSTPLSWDELSGAISSDHFTLENLPRRLRALRQDPWEDIDQVQQSLPAP